MAAQCDEVHVMIVIANMGWTDLLLHGAEAKSPAKAVRQVHHEGVYPLRFA